MIKVGIDLGSNTLRVVAIECESGTKVAKYEKIVSTAKMLHSKGIIGKDAINRVVEALKEAKDIIDMGEYKAVTTEAMRRASNSVEALFEIYKQSGVKFEVIDGDTEANLTLLAVKSSLAKEGFDSKSFVLVDIGGGSTELVLSYQNRVVSKSFPVGIVTMTHKYNSLDRLKSGIKEEMNQIDKFYKDCISKYGDVDMFVATAGTPTTIAALKHGLDYYTYDADIVNGTKLNKDELYYHLDRLLSLSQEKQERLVGVGRADLIVSGIVIFAKLFDIVGKDSVIVIDDGLREGVALMLCSK